MEITYKKEEKQRLDKFLAEELVDFSRSKIQKMIKDGQIMVNDQSVSPHYNLKTDDKIIIDQKDNQDVTNIQKSDLGIIPEIINETTDYLIINKPAGLIVHPALGIKEKTMVDWLLENYPKIKSVGENEDRPGIVHRLDKEVSGVMIVALSQKMFDHLKKQFRNHHVKKEYLALVHGKILCDEDVITFPLARSKISGKMVAKPKGEEGRDAITNFIVQKKLSRYTYIKVAILTGRTHQIRAHMQAYGHPVVGDTLYGNKKIKENIKLDRIFLHAYLLGFADLSNTQQEFKLPIPKELNNILNDLQ